MPECKLLARCRSSHFVDVDKRQTIFALSPNRKMLATWTPTKRLVIFLCKDGILFSSSMAPREHLGDRSESVRQLVWIGNKHVMIVDAVGGTKWNINTYDLVSEYHDFGKMPIFKSTGEDVYATCDSDNNVPVIEELTDPDLTDSFDESTERSEGTTKLCKYDGIMLYETGIKYVNGGNQDKLQHIVEFIIEPWHFPYNRTTTIFLLDDDDKRVLLFGKQTIQVWDFASREPSLQYIWCKPIPAVNYNIDKPSLGRDKEGDFVLKFRCNVKGSSEKQTLSLRPTEFETTLHALYARKFLEFKDHIAHQIGPSHGLHLSKLLKQCEEIVYRTIRTNAQIFNANVDDRSMVHLLIDLDSTFADSMLEELLQKNVYIPLFYENKKSDKNEESDENQKSDENKEPDENKKSALSCAILKGKAKVVGLLLKYYCRRTKDQESDKNKKPDKNKEPDKNKDSALLCAILKGKAKVVSLLLKNYYRRTEDPDENKESALSCAILKGKTKVVRLLLKYYCRRTEEKAKGKPEFWMQTVVPVFKKLVSKYPDSALELMKSISDLPLGEQTVWKNRKDLYAFICETDKVHEMSAPRKTDEIDEANKVICNLNKKRLYCKQTHCCFWQLYLTI